MHILNLGILAHVDAGKTSLTERFLHTAGVIDEIGSVDAGSTQTDTLALERARGITIKSAVASFSVAGVSVNLIDTPGHPDFIAEVERALGVLDGAVLVVSAVEGVQAQTRVIMRVLRRMGIPTVVFVNKVDRSGARESSLLADLAAKLDVAVVPMGSVSAIGTRDAAFVPYTSADPDAVTAWTEVLAERDDALLAAYVGSAPAASYADVRASLAGQTRHGWVHPVYFGSAITGAGTDELMAGLVELLPTAHGADDGPVSGTVFKVDRGPAGEKVAYLRMFAGTVRTRDVVPIGARSAKVTGIRLYANGSVLPSPCVTAGQIATVTGLGDVRVGDAVGVSHRSAEHAFAPPTLESVVLPGRATDRAALHAALTQLAEQDPLINLRLDPLRSEIAVSLYGEVQKEVVQATLADEFGLEVGFRETTTVCVERPVRTGTAVEVGDTETNPFLATVGLRVDPAPRGRGNSFALEVELGSMPYSFFKAVEETVTETLQQGPHGWAVTDVAVTVTRAGYWPRQSAMHASFDKSMSSTGGDFRNITPLVLMDALVRAGTTVLEPLHRFHLEVPADMLGPLLPALARLGAVPHSPGTRGATYLLDGDVPAASLHALTQALPGLTRGEGVLESSFDRYEPVRGVPPIRPRTDQNPLDRKEYLLVVQRRSLRGGVG